MPTSNTSSTTFRGHFSTQIPQPVQSGEYFKGKFASMIYQLYLQMKEGKRPRIFKHGEQLRDFVYIKDVLDANMRALAAKKSCVVNAGTGKPEDFNRVIACLNKELGLALKTDYIDNPYSFFQNKTQADAAHAKKMTGFSARYTLDSGIAEYVAVLERKKA